MKSLNNSTEKRTYCAPQIEQIKLDNEISLVLESAPPKGDDGDEVYNAHGYLNNDPFKTNLG